MNEVGAITSLNQKEGKYGIALGKDNWYNGMGTCPANKGDVVNVTFEVNGQWRNIKNIEVVSSSYVGKVDGPKPVNDIQQMSKLKNKTNARICALECATKVVTKEDKPSQEAILSMADEFVKFIENADPK